MTQRMRSVPWFTPHIAAVARCGPVKSRKKNRELSGCPVLVHRPSACAILYCRHISSKLSLWDAGAAGNGLLY